MEYFYLKNGDLIKEGDEIKVSSNRLDPEGWIRASQVGSKIDPKRTYRRLVTD